MIILLILPHRANTIIPTVSSICDSWMIVSNFARLSYLIWIFHIPFWLLLLAHLAYHITHIPAPDVAPRSHSASSPHIAARSHISSNLHLALSSLISCCILRIISLILHLLCIYFVRRSYFAAQSAHFTNIVIAQKNILGPGLYLIRTRVF
jgi:hypothetical protein